MTDFDERKAAAAKRGGISGGVCLAVAVAGAVFFAACYPVARVYDLRALLIAAYIVSPLLIAAGAAGAAVCNLKFGGDTDKAIRQYIIDTCLENAQAMHPERDSLTFYISVDGCKFYMRANGYKENIEFDFSAFKSLLPVRRAAIASEIGNRITVTFCRLYGRGARYKDVSYKIENGSKKSKPVPVIVNGTPDKRSYKIYLKAKRSA